MTERRSNLKSSDYLNLVSPVPKISGTTWLVDRLRRRLYVLEPPTSSRKTSQATSKQAAQYRQASYAPVATRYTSASHKPKLKASDLPKFREGDAADFYQWIEKIIAIYEYSSVHDSDLLPQLPPVSLGNALT